VAGLLTVLNKWRPTRVGHGIAAAQSEEAMRKLIEQDVVLEICPSSNLRTRVVEDLAELGQVIQRFGEHGVRFTINTDGPYLLGTHLRQEFDLLLTAGVLTDSQAARCIATAQAATFIPS
jgi:adenosine deaminase